MGDTKRTVKGCWLTKNNIDFTARNVFVNPFQALKPNQLDRSGLISKSGNNSFLILFPNLFLSCNPSKNLYIGKLSIELINFIEPCSVNIAKRKIIEQVIIGIDAQLFL
ncbi:hypothetical protein D3C71_1805210 [compost metagenome]